MAYYSYKRVRDLIPLSFQEKFERSWKEENGEDYEETADYDGTLWCLVAAYIEHLHADKERAKKELIDLEINVDDLKTRIGDLIRE